MIGLEYSHHFLNQSDLKLKSIATWSLLFSRASGRFLLLTLDSNWLLAIFSPFLTGCCDYFGFILRHSMEMRFVDTDLICWRWDYRMSSYFERIYPGQSDPIVKTNPSVSFSPCKYSLLGMNSVKEADVHKSFLSHMKRRNCCSD